MKFLLSILFLSCTVSFSQTTILDYVTPSKVDSLHVYASYFDGMSKQEIPQDLIEKYEIDNYYETIGISYVHSFYFDDKQKIMGIILEVQNSFYGKTYELILFDVKKDEPLQNISLAYYTEIEMTMEETLNSLIMDVDNDGDLDISCIKDLVDYELPNEFADNASSTEGYAYHFEKDVLVYNSIKAEVWKGMQLKQ